MGHDETMIQLENARALLCGREKETEKEKHEQK